MPNQVAFSVFGYPIYWYGLLIALAVALGVMIASKREKRLNLPKDTTIDFLLLALPLSVVCARLYYVIFAWPTYAAHPASIFNLREGGLAIYGGIIGGLLAALIFSRRRHLSFAALLDLCAPSLVLGQAIGRWGNFFNQEAYGLALTNPAWQFFPVAVFIEADGLWHAATFFYESVWCAAVFGLLLVLERKRRARRPGDLFAVYVFLYGLERVVVEGLRTDSLMLFSLRVSQWLSVFMVLLSLFHVLRTAPLTRRRKMLGTAALAALGALLACLMLQWLPGQLISACCVALAGIMLYKDPATK